MSGLTSMVGENLNRNTIEEVFGNSELNKVSVGLPPQDATTLQRYFTNDYVQLQELMEQLFEKIQESVPKALKSDLPFESEYSCHSLFQTIFEIPAEKDPERLLIITGGIHGNERGGWAAALHFLANYDFDNRPSNLNIVVVPCLNPEGIVRDTRCDLKNRDPNRCGAGYNGGVTEIPEEYTEQILERINPSGRIPRTSFLGNVPEFTKVLLGLIGILGVKPTISILGAGQNVNSEGFQYFENELPPYLSAVLDHLDGTLSQEYERVTICDMHTGKIAKESNRPLNECYTLLPKGPDTSQYIHRYFDERVIGPDNMFDLKSTKRSFIDCLVHKVERTAKTVIGVTWELSPPLRLPKILHWVPEGFADKLGLLAILFWTRLTCQTRAVNADLLQETRHVEKQDMLDNFQGSWNRHFHDDSFEWQLSALIGAGKFFDKILKMTMSDD